MTALVDMSIHDVSGVVGWCLGAYSEVDNTSSLHFYTLGPVSTTLYSMHTVRHLYIRPISSTTYLQHSARFGEKAKRIIHDKVVMLGQTCINPQMHMECFLGDSL